MQSKQVFFFILTIALVSLACGIGQGLSDVNIPFVSTKTNTPLPPNTPTVTPTYPPKLEGSDESYELELLENESTIFTDKLFGYRMRFPVEWLTVPLDENGQAELLDMIADELPEDLALVLESTMQQAGMRLVALDYTEKYSPVEDYIANIVVIVQETIVYEEVEMEALLDENVESVATLVPDARVNYQAVQTNPNGVEYAKMVISYPAEAFGVPVKQMGMIVKIEGGLLAVSCSVPEEMYLEVEDIFQRILDSLEFTE
jgi:type III secretion system FlhB-like substrate exporter